MLSVNLFYSLSDLIVTYSRACLIWAVWDEILCTYFCLAVGIFVLVRYLINNKFLTLSLEVTVHNTKHSFCWILTTASILVLTGSDIGRDVASGADKHLDITFI